MIIITKLLNPKNDYVFKRIFGYTGNEEITKDFLKSILLDNIKEIELDYNPITEKDLFDDKVGILDIKAKLNNNINCNIEMQIVDRKDIEKRLLFYWSKMYTSSIKSGMDYEKLEKSIIILISDYNLENLSEIQGYQTKWNIREEKNRHLVLTDVLEIYIIELEKAKKIIQKENNTLSLWLQFINNPEVVRDMENREIKKAKKILEELSQDKRERRLTELREKYIMDQKAIHNHGYDKGIEVGIKQGKIETAKKMRVKKMTIEEIVELTGLTKEEIEKL